MLEYKLSVKNGPCGDPACPECGNSLQNGIPDGSPELRRCADCKSIFGINKYEVRFVDGRPTKFANDFGELLTLLVRCSPTFSLGQVDTPFDKTRKQKPVFGNPKDAKNEQNHIAMIISLI